MLLKRIHWQICMFMQQYAIWRFLCTFICLFSSETLEYIIREIITIIKFILWDFFLSVLADGFSMEFEWQQVLSSLQDSSQYSVHSQWCYNLDSLHPSHNFQVVWCLYQSFCDCTKSTNYNWYNRHFHVPQFFKSLARSRYFPHFLHSFNFTLWFAESRTLP